MNCRTIQWGAFPSLQRRGGCGINKKSRSHRSAADGVVAYKPMFQNTFRNVTCERPPLLHKEGNMRSPVIHSHLAKAGAYIGYSNSQSAFRFSTCID